MHQRYLHAAAASFDATEWHCSRSLYTCAGVSPHTHHHPAYRMRQAVPWEAVVVDMRHRGRGITGRNTGVLAELGGRHRVLLMCSNPTAASLEDTAGFAQLIRPDVQVRDSGGVGEL